MGGIDLNQSSYLRNVAGRGSMDSIVVREEMVLLSDSDVVVGKKLRMKVNDTGLKTVAMGNCRQEMISVNY